MSRQQNIIRIKAIHEALGDMADLCVFVGGATVDLYSQRPAGEVRPTEDVDIIIELMHYDDFYRTLKNGFQPIWISPSNEG